MSSSNIEAESIPLETHEGGAFGPALITVPRG
jgi:hypothetical protein